MLQRLIIGRTATVFAAAGLTVRTAYTFLPALLCSVDVKRCRADYKHEYRYNNYVCHALFLLFDLLCLDFFICL